MPDQPNTPLDPPRVTMPPPTPPSSRRSPGRPAAPDNSWTQEDEDRYQEQRLRAETRARTRRRQGLSFFVIVLIVILIGLLGAAINQGVIKMPFGASATPTPCPTVAAPLKPSDVTVNVFNATTTSGLAATVSQELSARGYKVGQLGNAPVELRNFPDPVQIHHGPDGLEAAQSLAVQIKGAKLVQDERTDGTVDLLIGQAYTALVPAEEATAALTPAPAASPEGCTPAS